MTPPIATELSRPRRRRATAQRDPGAPAAKRQRRRRTGSPAAGSPVRRRPTGAQGRPTVRYRDPDGPIDPRIRERRAAVLRQQARRRLRVALVVLGALLLVVGAWLLVHSRLFGARVITVIGATHTRVDQVIAAAGLSDHPPLIDVGGAAVAGVERLPWVATATVHAEWPDGVRIDVVERTPAGAVPLAPPATGWAIVDRHGRVLADAAQLPAGFVTVAGTGSVGPPGTTATGVEQALTVAAHLPRAFAAQVTQVSQDAAGNVTLHLTSPVTVDLGSTLDLHRKFEDVAAILSGASLQSGQVIDVTAPGEPVVRP